MDNKNIRNNRRRRAAEAEAARRASSNEEPPKPVADVSYKTTKEADSNETTPVPVTGEDSNETTPVSDFYNESDGEAEKRISPAERVVAGARKLMDAAYAAAEPYVASVLGRENTDERERTTEERRALTETEIKNNNAFRAFDAFFRTYDSKEGIDIDAGEQLVGIQLYIGGHTYTTEEIIGAGGMGIVFKSTHPETGASVAIKVGKPERIKTKRDRPHVRTRMAINEVAILHELSKDDGIDPPVPVPEYIGARSMAHTDDPHKRAMAIVMEHIEGTKEGHIWTQEHAANIHDLQSFAQQLIAAIEGMHKRGIYNRDIKPSNVLVTEDGIVRPIDLGIAFKPERARRMLERHRFYTRNQETSQQQESTGDVTPAQAAEAAIGLAEVLGIANEEAVEPREATVKQMREYREAPHATYAIPDPTRIIGTTYYMPVMEFNTDFLNDLASSQAQADSHGYFFDQQKQKILNEYRAQLRGIDDAASRGFDEDLISLAKEDARDEYVQAMADLERSPEGQALAQSVDEYLDAMAMVAKKRDYFSIGMILRRLVDRWNKEDMKRIATPEQFPEEDRRIRDVLLYISSKLIEENNEITIYDDDLLTLEEISGILKDPASYHDVIKGDLRGAVEDADRVLQNKARTLKK